LICAVSHKSIVNEYVDDVLTGHIVASKLVKAACERHLRDLSHQDTAEFPYYFDEKEADDVCRFFPLALRHSKGQKFAGLPLDLAPWQVFTKWSIFGWKRRDDHKRRFRRAHIAIARKNGKTTEAAGVGLYGLTLDREPGAEVYVAATKKEQAKCLFDEAVRMRNSSPQLNKLISSHVNNLFVKSTNSYFRPMSSDRPFDGLNPHFVIFDELHAFTESQRKFHDTMTTGGGSRTQPLQLTITTAGTESSHIWLEEYNHCRGVVLNDFVDETIFAYIAEIDDDDDPLDEACWIKANPNLGVSVSMEYMRQNARDAKNKPSFYPVFVSKHCNKITSSTERAFDIADWDLCNAPLSDWSQADAFGCGIDLGARDDLGAYAIVARFLAGGTDENPIWRYEAKARAYIASDTVRDLRKQPFAELIYTGKISVTSKPVIDMRDDMLMDCYDLNVPVAAYDPHNAQQFSEDITQSGMQALRFTQKPHMFNEPIRELHACIHDKRFSHGGCQLLRWCASNAIIVKNKENHWMYDKGASSDKIDPIVSMTMALRVAMLQPVRSRGRLYL